jgi:hypothetical protein
MSNHPATNNHQEEIDLGYLIKKIDLLFRNCIKLLFALFTFILKFKILFFGILVLSIIYGYYKDTRVTVLYNNQAIIIPNFESVDYLYDRVDALNAKVRGKDSLYLKRILDTNYRKLRGIEIEPIPDIYNFASRSRENIDVLRILFQNQDFSEFVDDIATSKYYKYHRINFKILGEYHSQEMVNSLFDYLNTNEHFSNYQQITIETSNYELRQIDLTISQIDSILKAAASFAAENKSNQSVFINDNSQLNNLIVSKQRLIEDRHKLLIRKADQNKIIKPVKIDYNLYPDSRFRISNKVKYPVLFFFLFSFFFFLKLGYLKLKEIAESN